MAEFKRPTTDVEFDENFHQLEPIMTPTQAHYESSRCLFCYDAPCIKACPTGIDIPLFIKQINTKNVSGAADTIYHSNWMGNICGKVCPTEVLCEGACVYNNTEVKPIEIGRLQSFACSTTMDSSNQRFQSGETRSEKIAVIGSGPAGISAASELSLLGYLVTVYEAKQRPSGLALHGVAPYKIHNQDVLREVRYLQDQLGFEIKYGKEISSEQDFKRLEEEYEAIFLGIGLGNTREIGIPGERLPGCIGAVEFIENLKLQKHQVTIGNKVVILGGGNTAMDAASEACRLGANQVVLAYRRDRPSMRAYDFEYELAKSVGTRALWNVSPVEILGSERVSGVKFHGTEQDNGKLKESPENSLVVECDMVIMATGQSKHEALFQNISGLEWDHRGRIKTVNEWLQTHNPRYFCAGDAYNGGMEVVNAVAEAKVAARGIHNYLSQETQYG